MVSDVRAQMVEGAAALLSRSGVQATSFGAIIEATGAPRGSIYHHFPDGKEQLIKEAIDLLAARAFDPLERHAGSSAETIAREFISLWRSYLEGSKLQAGCAILAVTVTADSPQVIAHSVAVFRTWRDRLVKLLEQGGMRRKAAVGFAATLIAAIEGATVFSRAEGSMEPFDTVCAQMMNLLRHTNVAAKKAKQLCRDQKPETSGPRS